MTGSSDHEDVDVPLRLQPVVARPQGWRGRSPGLIAAGLAGFVVVAIVLATAFDDGRPTSSAPVAVVSSPASSPASPTPRPSLRHTARPTFLPSPLPARETVGGEIPTEKRLVLAEGLELLDLATGTLSPLARGLGYEAHVLPGGQIVCACVTETGNVRTVRFGRYEQTGEPIVEADILPLGDVVPIPSATVGFTVDAALDPEGTRMFVVVTQRLPPVYTVDLLVVDVETGEVIADTALDEVPVGPEEPAASASPSPSPRPDGDLPDGTYLFGGRTAVSEGGRTAFVEVEAATLRDGEWANRAREWMVNVGPTGEVQATLLAPPTSLPSGVWCIGGPVFLDADEVVEVCSRVDGGVVAAGFVRRIGRTGTSLGDISIDVPTSDGTWQVDVVIDRRNRAVYLWHPIAHDLIHVAIEAGTVEHVTVPDSMLPGASPRFDERAYPAGGTMVLSPDGRRVYALGVTGATGYQGAPSGIWVFETEPLELVDHWVPRAYVVSLAVSADGRFLYASGAAGFDAAGRQNPWHASVIVHDAVTGEVQVIYGEVSRQVWSIAILGP